MHQSVAYLVDLFIIRNHKILFMRNLILFILIILSFSSYSQNKNNGKIIYNKEFSSLNGYISNENGYNFKVAASGKYLLNFSSSVWSSNEQFELKFIVKKGDSVIASNVQKSTKKESRVLYNGDVHTEYNGTIEVYLFSNTNYNLFVSSDALRNLDDFDKVSIKQIK